MRIRIKEKGKTLFVWSHKQFTEVILNWFVKKLFTDLCQWLVLILDELCELFLEWTLCLFFSITINYGVMKVDTKT